MSDPGHPDLAVVECKDVSLAIVLVRRGAAMAASRALREHRGLDLPPPGRLAAAGAELLLWSGPDRFLAIRQDAGPGLAQELEAILGGFAYVVDASSSRLVLTASGEGAAEALNRLLPIDLHPRAFPSGSVALTISGHVAVQVWRPSGDVAFGLACASSFATSFRRQLACAGRFAFPNEA